MVGWCDGSSLWRPGGDSFREDLDPAAPKKPLIYHPESNIPILAFLLVGDYALKLLGAVKGYGIV